MRMAVISGSAVVNVIEVADSGFKLEGFTLVESATAAPGWTYSGSSCAAPSAVVPVTTPTISDRQFFQALAMPPYQLITPQEALDAVKTGEIPAVMQAVIDTMPEAQQFAATMLLAGATTFERSNPLVTVFAASQNMNEAATNAFWSFAASQ